MVALSINSNVRIGSKADVQASNVAFPPIYVATTWMFLMAYGSVWCGSAASNTKSASLPGVSEPLMSSSNEA